MNPIDNLIAAAKEAVNLIPGMEDGYDLWTAIRDAEEWQRGKKPVEDSAGYKNCAGCQQTIDDTRDMPDYCPSCGIKLLWE